VAPDGDLARARRNPPGAELAHLAVVRARGGRRQDPADRIETAKTRAVVNTCRFEAKLR
jgi:hypothetical protein